MKRIVVVLLALMLASPVAGCGGRLASTIREAAEKRNEGQLQLASFDEPSAGRILFRDDFEDGDLDGWQTTSLWSVEDADDGMVLAVSGSAEAAWVPEGVHWSDYYVRAGVRMESGGVSLSFRNSRDGSYWLLYRDDALYLIKESPNGNFTALTQTESPRLGAWHILAIGGYDGHLQVYVDTELEMDYVDSSPLTEGTITVACIDNAVAQVDNVFAVRLLDDLPTPSAGSELPPTAAPPAADLEDELMSLGDWVPEDDEPLHPVEPTSSAADESGWVEEEGPAPLVEPTSTPPGEPSWIEEEGAPPLVEPTSTPLAEAEWGGEEWSGEEPGETEEGPPPDELPVIDYFRAEPIADRPGCYYMHWDLHGADAAYLNGQGITAPGTGETCEPGTYTLRAENSYGEVEETLTITAEDQMDEPTAQPDLEITEVVMTPNQDKPNKVRVEIRVVNAGDAPTGAFTIRWFPHEIEDHVGCSIDAAGLAAHDSGRARCSYTYPDHGTMHWLAVVDQDNEIIESDDGNNTYSGEVVIERPSGGGQQEADSRPDLELSSFDVRAGLVPNDPLTVRLIAEVSNVGDTTSAPFTLRWYPSQDSELVGWSQDFPALEPNVSYPYDGGFTYPVAGEYKWRVIVDEDDEVDEIVEQVNNRDTGTVRVGEPGDEPEPQEGSKPDLTLANMHTVPSQLAPGQTGVIARFIVQNKGDGAAVATSALWYMGNVTYWSGSCEVPALDPGAYHQCEVELGPVPATADGAYDQVAFVDPQNQIAESRDDNNQLTRPDSVTVVSDAGDEPEPVGDETALPDLVVRNLQLDPSQVTPGQTGVIVHYTVLNQGDGPADPSMGWWYLLPGGWIGGCAVPALGPGEKHRCEEELIPAPEDVSGVYTQMARADLYGDVDESDEDNNDLYLYDSVTFVPEVDDDPDLVIENAHFEPDPVVKSEPFKAVMVVRNESQVPVTEPFSALWHFHAALGLQDCVWQFGQGLGPGASKRLVCERTTNAGPGQAPTAPTVDTDNVIAESDEVKNDVSVPMDIVTGVQDEPEPSGSEPKPDLLTENAHYEPDPVLRGQPFKAVVRVRNDSQVHVTEPFQVSWTFSSDLGLEDCWWDFEQGLAAGASKRLVCEGTTNAEAGNYFGAVNMHDIGDAIADSDYANNGSLAYMSVAFVAQDHPDPSAGGKPDLVIGNLKVSPNPVKPTGSLSIKYNVVNQAQVPAGPSQAEWRSKDAGFKFICAVPQLAGGASHTCEHTISVLPGVGSYHSQAIADVGKSVDEDVENNNSKKQPFKIQQ